VYSIIIKTKLFLFTLNLTRFALLAKAKERMMKEGLNSVKYEILAIEKHMLYTKFIVRYDMNETLRISLDGKSNGEI